MFILSLTWVKVSISFDICKFLSNFFQKIFNTVGAASTPGQLFSTTKVQKKFETTKGFGDYFKKKISRQRASWVSPIRAAIEAVRDVSIKIKNKK